MDKLNHYRNIIRKILLQHAEYSPSIGQIESLPIFNDENDQYFLIDYGWDKTGRVHSVVAHLEIKNNKIWIERDGFENGLATELLDAGVAKEDIVLGFYRPERRAITDFAVA